MKSSHLHIPNWTHLCDTKPKRRTYVTGSFRVCDVIPNVPEQDGDYDFRRAQLRQVAFGRGDLDDGLPSQILLQIFGNEDRYGEVPRALDDVAGNGDEAENVPYVELEYGLGQAQCYVGPHIE